METITLETIHKEIKELIADIEEIKCFLYSLRYYHDPEGELSDWAKKELEEARKTPRNKSISMDDVEKMILNKK